MNNTLLGMYVRTPNTDELSRAAWYEPIVCLRPENLKIAHTARVDAFTKLECGQGLVIGEYVHIASFVHVLGGGRCVFEDGSSAGSGAKIITGSNVPGYTHGCSAIAPDVTFERSIVTLKKNATVFAGAILLPGVVVGEGACVAAGAVVKAGTAIPAHEIWGGTPARFLKRIEPPPVVQPELLLNKLTEHEIAMRWLASMDELYGEKGA